MRLASHIVYAQSSQEAEDWEKRECRSKRTESQKPECSMMLSLGGGCLRRWKRENGTRKMQAHPEFSLCWSAFLLWRDSGLEVPTCKKAVCIQMIHECVWCSKHGSADDCLLKGMIWLKGEVPSQPEKKFTMQEGRLLYQKVMLEAWLRLCWDG